MRDCHKLAAAIAAAVVTSATAASAIAGTVTYVEITDGNGDISTANTYTHALEFGSVAGPATVNGVTFTEGIGPGGSGANSSNTFSQGPHPGDTGHAAYTPDGPIEALLQDMIYDGTGDPPNRVATLTLTGLTPGVTYDARIYSRRWDPTANRSTNISFNEDGVAGAEGSTGLINQNDSNTLPGAGFSDPEQESYYVNYRYTAASPSLEMTFTNQTGDTWHLYAVTNQVVPEPGSLAVLGIGAGALLARRRRRHA